jgi:transposase InsO family protein
VTVWRKDPTSPNLIKTIVRKFVNLCVPVKFLSDGGTQFDSREYHSFLQCWGVSFVPSTPHYPQSNGLAESAVKSMKKLVIWTVPNGDLDNEVFLQALVEWRNTPRHHGASPAEIVFGQPIRSLHCACPSSFFLG